LLQAGKLAEAIAQFEQVLRIRPEHAKTDPNFMAVLTAARRANAALSQCEQALRAKPDDPEAHNNLGGVLRQIGRVAEAIGHFEQALRIKPDYAEAHYNLALATAQTGKEPEAIGHYTEALRAKPDFVLALNNLAWMRATHEDPKLRDGAEAVRLAEHACQLTHRKEWGVLDTLAAAYAEAGRFSDAMAAAEAALGMAKLVNQAAADDIQSRLTLYRAERPYREDQRKTLPGGGQ
jgi:tetratricopeptide (TPR) repeat protein